MIAPMPSMQGNTETNVKLPFSFIFYSLVSFVASQVLLLSNGAAITDGIFRTPMLWMSAHLLVLGWALMVAMGAMYQLVPVVFLTPIWNERFGFAQFWVTAVGIATFAVSLGYFPKLILYTGLLTLAGIFMFLYQMFRTIKSQPKRDILHLFIGSSLGFLMLTIVLGILLAANFNIGLSWVDHEAVLKTHILFGIAGWFSFLIFGFSYKMVPMFSLSHGFSMKLSKYVYSFYMAGMVLGALAFFMDTRLLMQAGAVLLFIGFTLFVIHVKEIIDKRLKKKLDKPFMFSLIAILIGWTIHFAGMIVTFIPDSPQFWYGILIYVYLFGWVIFSIIGYLYKIVPFLWWTHKYSGKMGKTDVPALKDLINERLGVYIFSMLGIAVLGMTAALISSSQSLFYASQAFMVTLSVLFSGAIVAAVRK